jgi:hypothetical protein
MLTLPAMKLGLLEEAEILNRRLAMVGIMLDIFNEWVGGVYY